MGYLYVCVANPRRNLCNGPRGRAAREEVAFRGPFLPFSSTPYRRSPIHRSPPFIKVAGTGGEELSSSTLGFASSAAAVAAAVAAHEGRQTLRPGARSCGKSLFSAHLGRAVLAAGTETARRGCLARLPSFFIKWPGRILTAVEKTSDLGARATRAGSGGTCESFV